MKCHRFRPLAEVETLMKEIDERIKTSRTPVCQICKDLGVSATTYYGWKSGKRNMNPSPRRRPSPITISTQYNPRTESILVGAGV